MAAHDKRSSFSQQPFCREIVDSTAAVPFSSHSQVYAPVHVGKMGLPCCIYFYACLPLIHVNVAAVLIVY